MRQPLGRMRRRECRPVRARGGAGRMPFPGAAGAACQGIRISVSSPWPSPKPGSLGPMNSCRPGEERGRQVVLPLPEEEAHSGAIAIAPGKMAHAATDGDDRDTCPKRSQGPRTGRGFRKESRAPPGAHPETRKKLADRLRKNSQYRMLNAQSRRSPPRRGLSLPPTGGRGSFGVESWTPAPSWVEGWPAGRSRVRY